MSGKFITTVALGGIIVLLGVCFALSGSMQGEKEPGEEAMVAPPTRLALTGTYVCLPHADPTLWTKECAAGMKTDAGVHYVLDLGLMSQTPPELSIGDHFRAHGVVTPIEYVSTDHWRKYDVEGVFSVTDSLVIN